MGDDDDSTASMAAQHSVAERRTLKVAPTDGTTKFNTIRIPLVPVACWRLNDPAFGFDSSFVAPTFRGELETLSGIVAANPECPAALFGHCDPAGSDAINKTLGDRRAIAIYALLTRQPDLWEDLYTRSQVGDRWGMHAIQTMLRSIDDPTGAPYYAGPLDGQPGGSTSHAIKQFQGDNTDLSASGQLDAATRKKLFQAYMDWLCTPDPPGPPLQLTQADFLGGVGAQPGDLPKMSLQSCGKLNPIVLLTAAEMQGYDEANRNADDAPNRRVLMFFFAKGTTVDTSVWPCPKVHETGDACKAAFWPAGDARRKNGAAKRVYRDTRDTMACRFYDRFARRSPCEGAPVHLSVAIGLDVPVMQKTLIERFRLTSDDGTYLQERTRAEAVQQSATRWLVRFTRVTAGLRYSLVELYGQDVQIPVFTSVLIQDVTVPDAPPEPAPAARRRHDHHEPLHIADTNPSLYPGPEQWTGNG